MRSGRVISSFSPKERGSEKKAVFVGSGFVGVGEFGFVAGLGFEGVVGVAMMWESCGIPSTMFPEVSLRR